jgi:hypothetical protein
MMGSPSGDSQPAGLPRCTDCIHYYITHEAQTPYGCRRLGFKSAQSPARVVFQASGQPCLNFEERK